MSARILLVAAALWANALAAAPAPPKRPSAPPAEFGVPGVVPVAQLWTEFAARADEDAVAREYAVADDLFSLKSPDAARCKARRDDLDRAVRRVPISFYIWYVRRSCADALGDTQRAQESEQAFAALARQAFAQLPPDHGTTAIPVYQLVDAWAIAIASGDEQLYGIFDLADRTNGDPLVIGLRDRDTGRERTLRFDFVSSIIAVRRQPDDEHYPAKGMFVARNTIESMAKARTDDSAIEAQAVIDAVDDDSARQTDAILHLAQGGSYTAALAAGDCLSGKESACAGKAVDVLLPFAEKGYGYPLILLARAHALGRGVHQDAAAAKVLLQGAAKRLGDGVAYALFLGLGQNDGNTATPIDDWAFEQLARAADAGDPWAAQVAGLFGYMRHGDPKMAIPARERAWLELAERAGLPAPGRVLAADARQRKDDATALRYLRKWADRDAGAAAQLATAYESGSIDGLARDPALALQWRKRAGMLGDADAMRWVAEQALDAGTPASRRIATLWLSSGAVAGDWDATLELADLYSDSAASPEDTAHAIALYRSAMADHDSPHGRRGLARLLMDGRGIAKDPAQAKQMLLKDAEAGNADAQLLLASALFNGKFGAVDRGEAWSWVRKADATGSRKAAKWIANASWSGTDGLPLDRRTALATFARLAQDGDTGARNDYAWALCTGSDPALRDPAKGLAASLVVVAAAPTAVHLDTEAACLAGISDFAQAATYQDRAIAALPPGDSATRKGMLARRALYRSRRAWIEPPAAAPADGSGK